MDKRDNFNSLANIVLSASRKTFDDITEEESLAGPEFGICPMVWQAGHSAAGPDFILRNLDKEGVMPEEWEKLFRGGVGLPEVLSVFPPYDEVKEVSFEVLEKLISAVEESSIDLLDEKKELTRGWIDTPYDAGLFMLSHAMYHLGQAALIRKKLGRKSLFG